MSDTVRRSALMICFCIWSLILTACQKSPESAIVVDKSEGLASSKIIPVDDDNPKKLEIPSRWQEDIEMSDGYVTMTADCELNIPEVYNTPVDSYEMEAMTDDFLKRLCDYFADGNKLYAEPQMTKEELKAEKEKIVNFQGEWSYYAGRGLYDPTFEERLEKLDELIEAAPATKEQHRYITPELTSPTPTDKEKIWNSATGWQYWYYETDEKAGFTARVETNEICEPVIRATAFNTSIGSATNFLYSRGIFKDEKQLERDFEYLSLMERTNNDYEDHLNFLKNEMDNSQDEYFTQEDALKKVEEVLKDLSIELSVTDCVKAIGTTERESWAGLENGLPVECTGYSVYLSPKAGSLIAYTLPRTVQSSGLPEQEYAPAFLPEQLNIVVTRDGIQKFEWMYISKKKDSIAENTKLMTFEEIAAKFEDHLLYYTLSVDFETAKEEGYTTHYEVNDVQLRAVNINAYEEPLNVWLVPAWIFEVTYQRNLPTGDIFMQYDTCFMFNAIDGGYVTVPM